MEDFPILIIALSARAYVQAAKQAGFRVWAIDAYADADTQQMAEAVFLVPAQQQQFDADALLNVVENAQWPANLHICLGAGFEAQPALIDALALRFPLLANSSASVRDCKNPDHFQAFCRAQNMNTPVSQWAIPQDKHGWFSRQTGGSGGLHIKPLLPLDSINNTDKSNTYYQKEIAGESIACLFLAEKNGAHLLGWHRQWHAPLPHLPFRLGGMVSQIAMPSAPAQQAEKWLFSATQKFGLRGLCSADFIWDGEALFALELNPRLSASVGLYQLKKSHLFAAHVASFFGEKLPPLNIEPIASAIQIIYANQSFTVPNEMDWPDFVADIPAAGSVISAGEPICSVHAQARSAQLAEQKVRALAAQLSADF